jgi:hypothetical protein
LTIFAVTLLQIPYLKVVGALLLLWIGYKLLADAGGHDENDLEAPDKLFAAVKTIIVADLVMSLDNTTEFQSAHRPVLLQTDDGGASPPELADAVVSRDTKIIPSKEIIARRLQALREAKAQQTGAIKDDSASLPAKIESKSNVVEASDTLAKIESQSNVVSWRSWMQHVNSDTGKWSKRKGKREELDAADIDRFMIEVEKEQDEEITRERQERAREERGRGKTIRTPTRPEEGEDSRESGEQEARARTGRKERGRSRQRQGVKEQDRG